jgi:AraC-like DNA-binding protein
MLEGSRIQGLQSLEFEPWGPLRSYVRKISVHEAGPGCPAILEVLPRLNLVIGFQYGENVKAYRDGSEQTLHRSGLTGLQTSTRRARHSGAKYVLAHLRAWSGPAFLPGSMADFLDGHVDLGSVLPRGRIAETQQRVEAAASPRERVETVQRFLLGILRAQAVDPVARAAVGVLLESERNARVEELARDLGLSVRQLERRFRRGVGISPKQFAMLLRFGQSLRWHSQGLRTADIALACGYFDQSHFTRAFERIAGRPPGRFFSEREACSWLP